MKSSGLPRWLVITLAVVGAVVLLPPLLGLAIGAVALLFGLLVGLGAVALKVGAVAAVVYVLWLLIRGGRGEVAAQPTSPRADLAQTLEGLELEVDRSDREQREELDRELERALVQHAAASGGPR